ncbi:MAG: hypothetical protein ISS16_09585 [Ignavibacteria bacterium]|nr:hypothetical protein [Ignavibacteria bacterium]
MLEQEIKIFENNKAKLKEDYPSGGFVVIKDKEILGVWNDRQDALKAGIEKYGNVSFLVKDILENDNVINFSRDLKFV